MRGARAAGVLVYSGTGLADGTDGDAILLGPPFVVTEAELTTIADVVTNAVDAATGAAMAGSTPAISVTPDPAGNPTEDTSQPAGASKAPPPSNPGPIRAVVFDVGETLVDETRPWSEWADWLGIPRLTLFAVLGGVIARGQEHRGVFEVLRPGLDMAAESRRRREAGGSPWVMADDLYPDALPAFAALRAAGYLVGVAGNQPLETERVIASLGVPLDLVASSAGLGVEKPDLAFFERISEELRLPPTAIAYVGDRIDNDIGPALAAGMCAIFVRRGPWAYLQALDGVPAGAATIDSLLELPVVLARLAASGLPAEFREPGAPDPSDDP